jgi:hypothetical protein
MLVMPPAYFYAEALDNKEVKNQDEDDDRTSCSKWWYNFEEDASALLMKLLSFSMSTKLTAVEQVLVANKNNRRENQARRP